MSFKRLAKNNSLVDDPTSIHEQNSVNLPTTAGALSKKAPKLT